MTLSRMLLPYLIGGIGAVIVIWWIALTLNRRIAEIKPYPTIVAGIITAGIVISLMLTAFNFAAMNEIPRSVIDRTTPSNMKNDFEDRMKEKAAQPKVCDDTIKNCK